jgi:putative tryptophan/tyrosine transport system ATP-binding protein
MCVNDYSHIKIWLKLRQGLHKNRQNINVIRACKGSVGVVKVQTIGFAWVSGSKINKNITSQFERYKAEVRQLEMQLEDRLDHLIGSLSGGQRQALTLLMAVITQPKVLLLDEHTAALDPKSAAQVIQLTRRFIEQGKLTAIMVTHSMHQALDVGDRTIMMHKGQVIDDIPHDEKRHLTVNDLLDKFAELRKSEQLTDDMLEALRREYV